VNAQPQLIVHHKGVNLIKLVVVLPTVLQTVVMMLENVARSNVLMDVVPIKHVCVMPQSIVEELLSANRTKLVVVMQNANLVVLMLVLVHARRQIALVVAWIIKNHANMAL